MRGRRYLRRTIPERSTAPQKGPIRSNLRGSSIGPSLGPLGRTDGRTDNGSRRHTADRVSRSRLSERGYCQREKALTFLFADIGAYVAINLIDFRRADKYLSPKRITASWGPHCVVHVDSLYRVLEKNRTARVIETWQSDLPYNVTRPSVWLLSRDNSPVHEYVLMQPTNAAQ